MDRESTMVEKNNGGGRLWQLVLISATLSTLFVVLIASAGFLWLRSHAFSLRIPLGGQRMAVVLPHTLSVTARATNQPRVRIDGRVPVHATLNHTFTVPVDQTIHAHVHFDHDVPLHLTVRYNGSVPVDQTLHVDTTVHAHVFGIGLDVPVKGDIPIHTSVPVHLNVPVNRKVHLDFTAPVTAYVHQRFRVPIKASLQATVPLHHAFRAHIAEPLQAEVELPRHSIPITVKSWKLALPRLLGGNSRKQGSD